MEEEKSSYRKIMKSTSIFGGVQILNIIVSIIRFKFIAVFLGPMGMGIAGLFTATINLISGLTNFGLGTSAVKNVAAANAKNDSFKIAKIITILRRLVWLTGLLGSIITMVFSKTLSIFTFGNENFTYAFIWLSITLLLMQLSKGQLAILQGLRKIKHLASANLLGSIFGLIFTLPIYYYFGIKGIVPAIIITALISLFFSWYFARKIDVKFIPVSLKRTFFEGKEMLYLGIMISMSSLIALVGSYGVRIFISNNGGFSDVGLFTAGFDVINGYMGIILVAMASDYFPRLASVANNNQLCKKAINEQAEIVLLLLSPIIIVFIIFINWIVILLYSPEFLEVNVMIQWASIGLIFKASSWSVAYVLLAKGAGKLYFINEFVAVFYTTVLNLVGYKFMGMEGLGISFLASYILYFIQILVIVRKKYNFSFNAGFKKVLLVNLFFTVVAIFVVKLITNPYWIGLVILILSICYSLRELDRRIDIRMLIVKFKNK